MTPVMSKAGSMNMHIMQVDSSPTEHDCVVLSGTLDRPGFFDLLKEIMRQSRSNEVKIARVVFCVVQFGANPEWDRYCGTGHKK